LALAAVSAAFAFPTVTGTTGGILVPSSDVSNGVTIATTNFADFDDDDFQFPPTVLLYGKDAFEIGAGYAGESFYNEGAFSWSVFGKWVLPVALGPAKLAAGAEYRTDDDDYHTSFLYLTGTMPVFSSSKLTLTALHTDDSYYDENKFTFMANLEKTLESGAAVGLEWYWGLPGVLDFSSEFNDASNAGKPQGAAYITYPVDDQLSLRLGISGIVLNTEDEGDNAWVLGAAYTL